MKKTRLKVNKVATRSRRTTGTFRIGPKWLKSIKDGKGPALRAANLPKLLETAKEKGVRVHPKTSQATIVERIAEAL